MAAASLTALVTGANRGLGFAVARELARRGDRVFVTARSEGAARQAADAIGRDGRGQAEAAVLDVSDAKSITALAERLRAANRSIDLLVNNAAITMDGFDERVARATLDTNFYGPLRVADALLPLMPDGAAIVMVSSGAGELSILSSSLRARFIDRSLDREALTALVEKFVDDVRSGRHSAEGWPTSAYGVSKAALNALVRVLAPVLGSRRIRINAVCPGWVRTDMGGPGAPRSIEQGASSILWAALLEGDRSGGFYRDGKAIPW